MPPRFSRDLHPVAWWVWALGLATAAALTTNPLQLLLLVAMVTLVVVLRRSAQPWGASFRLYVLLAVLIVVLRVVFRILFGAVDSGPVWLHLPPVPLPDWVAGLTLLGPVTRDDVLGGLYDGLRLATIVVCVGAANALANPKRLLASMPPALYEVGTALVVAVTVFPSSPSRSVGYAAPRSSAAVTRAGWPSCGDGWCRCWRTPWSDRWRSPPAWMPAATGVCRISRRGPVG